MFFVSFFRLFVPEAVAVGGEHGNRAATEGEWQEQGNDHEDLSK